MASGDPDPREIHPAQVSTARLRGALWAERVARLLVARWPIWRPSPRSLAIAARHVEDLANGDLDKHARLARICFVAAAKRFRQVAHFLDGSTIALAHRDDDEETPL